MEWITIAAIILGPIFAVQVSENLAERKEKKHRKFELFQKLMSTRGNRLSQAHVEALNMIDLTFYGDEPVVEAWKLYLDHLNQRPQGNLDSWYEKSTDMLNQLLLKMSQSIGYNIDQLTINKAHYNPQAHVDRETNLTAILEHLSTILRSGAASIKPDDFKQPLVAKEPDSKK